MLPRRADPVVPISCLPPQQALEIRVQLDRLLNSQQFRTSKRCQSLLRHVTEHTLEGDTANLKERVLGMEVFGRVADYDTNQDPIVRATAAEIRKKLAQYYQEPGHESEPRIELISGGYVPEFHKGTELQTLVAPPRRWGWMPVAAGVAALVLLAVAAWALPTLSRSGLEQFWGPILEAPGTVLISMGQPAVYNLVSARAQDQIQGVIADRDSAPAGLASASIPMNQLVILRDRYLALGDAVCLARLASVLEKHGKQYRIRGEGSTSSSDLRENAAVLIGAFDNHWTLRAAGQLRFTFVKDSAKETDMVHDRQHPERTDWKLTGAWPYWDNIQNDYAIVSRLLDANTDRPVVIAAGITHFGTMAAGELLSNPAYFSEVVQQLPRGWQKKNLQIVLRVPVVQGASGHPRVLATQVW